MSNHLERRYQHSLACACLLLLSACSPKLSKEEADFWDIVIKAIGGVVALTGAWSVITAFQRDRRAENEARRAATEARIAATEAQFEAARKPFREKRAQVYDALLNQTSRIGNTRNGTAERKAAVDEFWFIFWGPLPLIADLDVGRAANQFTDALEDPEDEVGLRNASMSLAEACRISLGYADVGQYPNASDAAKRKFGADDLPYDLGNISEQAP